FRSLRRAVPSGRPRAFLGSGSPVRRQPDLHFAGGDMKNPSGAFAREGSRFGPDRLGLQGASLMSARVAARRKAAQDAQSIGRSFFHSPLKIPFRRETPRARDAASTPVDLRCQAHARNFFGGLLVFKHHNIRSGETLMDFRIP